MEDALRDNETEVYTKWVPSVLILILMEDALRDEKKGKKPIFP